MCILQVQLRFRVPLGPDSSSPNEYKCHTFPLCWLVIRYLVVPFAAGVRPYKHVHTYVCLHEKSTTWTPFGWNSEVHPTQSICWLKQTMVHCGSRASISSVIGITFLPIYQITKAVTRPSVVAATCSAARSMVMWSDTSSDFSSAVSKGGSILPLDADGGYTIYHWPHSKAGVVLEPPMVQKQYMVGYINVKSEHSFPQNKMEYLFLLCMYCTSTYTNNTYMMLFRIMRIIKFK